MRITPSHPRLRVTAIACMIIGAWALLQPSKIVANGHPALLAVAISIAAILSLTIGVVFWLLGTDRRAGVVFDSKGLMLNLGHSAAFISWQNITEVGLSHRRSNLFALGSKALIGIRLDDPSEYIQSYETRIPASRSVLASAVRLIQHVIHMRNLAPIAPTLAEIETIRRRTGYDLLIPESLLGGHPTAFVEMVDAYRRNP
ncbi:MAG: DUF2982 domain-containing protein, partial [Oscillochloris sp.]|nr:DUF2982 domain-containing protein [Oscillochloris sp.]